MLDPETLVDQIHEVRLSFVNQRITLFFSLIKCTIANTADRLEANFQVVFIMLAIQLHLQ